MSIFFWVPSNKSVGWWTGSRMMMLRRLDPCTCAPWVCISKSSDWLSGHHLWPFIGPTLQHSVSCRHHSSKTQSLVPVPVLRDARVTYILLPLLILVTSLSRTSLIGSDWQLGFHVDMTPPQRLLHITQQNHKFFSKIMNMQFHVPVNEWKLLICLRILFCSRYGLKM